MGRTLGNLLFVFTFALTATPGWSNAPQRIVSLSPTATEILFAIGAGEQVVAVDSLSNYPTDAPTTPLSSFEPNLEAIATYDPDLVVMSFDPRGIGKGLQAIGVTVINQATATSLDDMYGQIAELGAKTGHPSAAAEVSRHIRTGLQQAAASILASGKFLPIYHELDATYYSISSASFLGQVYQQLGLINIADDADENGYGYPQLSPEYILQANPAMIVITDQAGYSTADVASRPGWQTLEASKQNRIIQVNADIASRWGPRIVEFAQFIADHAR